MRLLHLYNYISTIFSYFLKKILFFLKTMQKLFFEFSFNSFYYFFYIYEQRLRENKRKKYIDMYFICNCIYLNMFLHKKYFIYINLYKLQEGTNDKQRK